MVNDGMELIVDALPRFTDEYMLLLANLTEEDRRTTIAYLFVDYLAGMEIRLPSKKHKVFMIPILRKAGRNREEIATILELNIRTVDKYYAA